MATATRKKTPMTPAHKAALAEGSSQSRAVRNYLEALEAHKPKRGRKRTPDSMKKQLDKIDADLAGANPLRRLQLTQQRLDLQHELEAAENTVDLAGFEQDFIGSAKAYGDRKGISFAAWRELGVPAAVLKQAGITRAG